jgi:dihydrodipicolinate synthase/N-acetylneuraminate lyase
METEAFGMTAELKKTVIAVPPLARNRDLTLNRDANAALIRRLEAGGIRTLMYGGNANFYNIGLYEYASVVDQLRELTSPGTWVIPSVGPDFGKMMDQAELLRDRSFSTAMILPASGAFTENGLEAGIRRFVDRAGKQAILYIRGESYLSPAAVERLVSAGVVQAIKYAIVRRDPQKDPFLDELVKRVDRGLIISGIGERPAIVHLRDFKLAGFTSGSVCIAPRLSQAMLEALRREEYTSAERLRQVFIPIEDCRDAHNPMRVLHEAVTLAGIADMGPMLPLMSNLDSGHVDQVRELAAGLRAMNDRPLNETG